MSDALNQVKTAETPQSQPLPGRDQVQNNAGGYTFKVGDMERFRRFLILGVDGGTYYVGEQKHTADNVALVRSVVENNGIEAINEIVAVSDAGRAPTNSPAVFALAAATVFGNDVTRAYAYENLGKVVRIGTHLFEFVNFRKNLGGGFGRGTRKALGGWYTDRSADGLAYQAIKYRNRHGWSHRDVLRVSHPKVEDPALAAVLDWVTHGKTDLAVPAVIEGFEKAQAATRADKLVSIVREYGLPWEAVPTQFHNKAALWRALIEEDSLPLGAMIRQLGRMSSLEVDMDDVIAERLADVERIHKSRIHPIKVLLALKVYQGGQSRATNWTPSTKIVDALDGAFYDAFKNVVPADRRTLVGLDVSGSMAGSWWGYGQPTSPLTPREATAAMAMIQIATEPKVDVMGFSTQFIPLDLSKKRRLDDVIKSVSGLPFGGTDCSLPMTWASKKGREYDTFIVYTDNETWAGRVHPSEALKAYRKKTGINARLVVAATDATPFSIADPKDPGMLDVVGFDATVPNVIADFSAGRA